MLVELALVFTLGSAEPSPLPPVGFELQLGAQLDGALDFVDDDGEARSLAQLIGERPAVLVLAYFGCRTLCSVVLNDLVAALKGMALEPGRHFDVVVVSIDPTETPRFAHEKKLGYLRRYGRADAQGFHFVTGRAEAIDRLTRAVGFRYRYDEASGQYAHPAGIMVVTPQRTVSSYLFGIAFTPRDLRLALVQASEGKVGSVIDRLLLTCFTYSPATGSYAFTALAALRVGALLTTLGLVGLLGGLLWRERKGG